MLILPKFSVHGVTAPPHQEATEATSKASPAWQRPRTEAKRLTSTKTWKKWGEKMEKLGKTMETLGKNLENDGNIRETLGKNLENDGNRWTKRWNTWATWGKSSKTYINMREMKWNSNKHIGIHEGEILKFWGKCSENILFLGNLGDVCMFHVSGKRMETCLGKWWKHQWHKWCVSFVYFMGK